MKKETTFKQERLRIFDDKRKDPYEETRKHPEPTLCSGCGALYSKGRWTWKEIPEVEINETFCPACRRITEKYPAGLIELSGDFFLEHRMEILNMVNNIRRMEVAEHPLERIMDISDEEEKTVITTTGIHLARRIGDAVANSYQGTLDYNYESENFIRVNWNR